MAKSKNLAKTLMESINDCVLITDARGVIQDINDNGLSFLGFKVYDKEGLKGQHISAIFTPKKVRLIQKNLHKVSSKKQNVEFETEITTTTRKKLFISASFNYVKVGNKEILLLVFRDQSIFHTVNTMMDNYDEQYQTMIETCPCGLLVLKPTGEIIDVNQAYVKMSGYNWDHLVKMNYLDLLSINGFDKKEFINKNSKIYKIPHKTKDGQLLQVKNNVAYFGDDIIYIFVDNINKEIELMNSIQQWRVQVENFIKGLKNQEGVGILVTDQGVGFTFANDYILEVFGYTLNEFSERSYLAVLMDENHSQEYIEKSMEVINGDVARAKFKAQFVRKDRTIFLADVEMINHKLSSGDTVTVIQFENIKNTESTASGIDNNNLASIAAKYIDDNKTGIILATSQGIAYSNSACCRAFGYQNNEMVYMQGPSFVNLADMVKIASKGMKVYTGLSKQETFSCRYSKKGGGVLMADTKMVIHKEGKEKYLVLQLNNIDLEVAV